MPEVVNADGELFDTRVSIVIIGAGAAGLCAALAAKEAGAEPVVVERDPVPSGSTALSAGLIPAAGTRFQRAKGIDDSPEVFAADIQRKAHGENDPTLVEAIARNSGPTVEWLAGAYGFPFDVVDNFNYPGHSALRMHGLPSRTGRELIDCLRQAAEASGVTILMKARADRLFVDGESRIHAIEIERTGGGRERIGCAALVLACNGYGGNPSLVRELIPEMAEALYFGHPRNQGDAVTWGRALGARLANLGAYQGHGSVATPHNTLITWAVIMQGGVQVNAEGRRFSDESRGYSEQAAQVLRQPGAIAWSVFDARMAQAARQFEDFRAAERAGAIVSAPDLTVLAQRMSVEPDALAAEWREAQDAMRSGRPDRFGRIFANQDEFQMPWHAVKVTGALFHTQGGLAVDIHARVLRNDGSRFPNLFAAGGAAAGVSGGTAAGYLSGNGLVSATVLGRLAGRSAALALT
jgi:flavocytochrome c